ncbi:MAG: phosphoglycolate phosphatase [Myxococcales bacterium]|nr:phosphoglycolate phosphatase [Myxococcales bacterium]MCB9644853.1 phosphoglycolate phosphatase [Myxococcales bacterium]
MRPIQLVIFDLDGTLIDSSDDIVAAMRQLLGEMHLSQLSSEQIMSFVGQGVDWLVRRCLEACGMYGEESVLAAVQRYRALYKSGALKYTHLYTGVRETLERLRLGPWELAVCTNKPENIARKVLSGLGISQYFLALLGGDSLSQRKPDAAPLRLLMELLDVEPAETLMVGDSEYDMAAGQAAGVWTCAAAYGFHGIETLEPYQPHAWLTEFPQILSVLGVGEAS